MSAARVKLTYIHCKLHLIFLFHPSLEQHRIYIPVLTSLPYFQQNMASFRPPSSYSNIQFEHISLSHHPVSSPTVTPIIIICIDRVDKNNAFTSEMEYGLVKAFDMLDLDDRVKAIVVTGKGRMFCAGADLEIGLHREPGIRDKEHRDGYVVLVIFIGHVGQELPR